MPIFPIFYFGSIEYYTALKKEKNFKLEAYENFPKQTLRNRCFILGANGKLRLSIPIKHTGNRCFKDIQISYDYDWQKEHLKSLHSAYQSSPYFEFYEADLQAIFNQKEKYLLDLNLKTIIFIKEKIKLSLDFQLTQTYQKTPITQDYRLQFNPKKTLKSEQKKYTQVFSSKFDFIPNLSILDLLCNEGPNTSTYL